MQRWLPAVALVVVFALATSVGPTSDTSITDFGRYRVNAQAVLDGDLPYRDFALEYPPGSLVPMIAPALIVSTKGFAYKVLFAVLMCACLLVVQRQAARLAAPHERAAAWALALLPLLAGAIVRVRFDLFAVALAVTGLRLVIDRRTVPGFALLGLGAATKVFPIVFAAAGVAWLLGRGRRSDAVRGAAVTVGVIGAVCLPFALAAPDGFAEQFRFHAERPLQIESLPATLARLVGDPEVTGTTAHPDHFRSQGVRNDTLAALFTALQLAAVLAAVAWAYRSRTLLLPAAAALLAFVALGKVLSPQYMLWIAPLAPALWFAGARASSALIVAALVLTQLEFPWRYPELVRGELTLVSARDLALVAALVLLVPRSRTAPGRSA